MQIKSIYRGARISAFKARDVTREIQGLPVAHALDNIMLSAKKAAFLVGNTLKSAIANAENNANLRAEKLVVQEATVGEGPTLKRFQPKARGSAGPIRKRTSHIRIILTDEIEVKTRRSRAAGAKKKTKSRATPAASKQRPKRSATPASAAGDAGAGSATSTSSSATAAE
jgi:large subunit ribosomal protein L22